MELLLIQLSIVTKFLTINTCINSSTRLNYSKINKRKEHSNRKKGQNVNLNSKWQENAWLELKITNQFYFQCRRYLLRCLCQTTQNRPWYREIPTRLQECTIQRRVMAPCRERKTGTLLVLLAFLFCQQCVPQNHVLCR